MPLKVSPSTLIGIVLLTAGGLLWIRQKPVPTLPASPAESPEPSSRPVIFFKKITPPQSPPTRATIPPSPDAEARYQEAWQLVHRRPVADGERVKLLQEALQALLALQNDHPTWEPLMLQRRLLQTEDLLHRASKE